jgi:hypothetical protein
MLDARELTDLQWAILDGLIPEPPRRRDGRGRCSPQKVCSISRGDLLQPIFVVQSAEHLLSSYPTIRR